ncbi:NAD kinase [Flavobacteriales bacterium]|nr:NAD kinase [Flavobacteriales bacterium]
MTILLHGKLFSKDAEKYIFIFINELLKQKIDIIFTHSFYQIIQQKKIPNNKKLTNTIKNVEEANTKINYLICFGGDGTILNAATIVKNSGIPIIGINTGRLGFLATIAKNETTSLIKKIKKGEFKLSQRAVLNIEGEHDKIDLPFALNEISVLSKEKTSMMNLKVFLNEEYLNTYWADGIIISTPTGSTGYSLSCGGPIVMPESKNLIITPIAPHNLNVRPLVVSDENTIRIEVVDNPNKQFSLSMDSRHYNLLNKVTLTIQKANYNINLLQLDSTTYSKTLREKLLWGLDKRNYE